MLYALFVENGPSVPEKKILKGFYHIWALRSSWSCDLGFYIHFGFPFLQVLHFKFAFFGHVVAEEKLFEYYGNIIQLLTSMR